MRPNGDVPKEILEQSDQLQEMESLVDNDPYTNERKAQIYTCLAHDWYQIDMEEEGNRLLLKANKVCPGYFSGPVIKHQLESESFDIVIKNLTFELLNLLTDNLRNK